MPEVRENTIGNKICQKFIEEQPAEDRILANIYTDIAGNVPCLCNSPNTCPASEGHVHELLSTYPPLKKGTGLYPAMYSETESDIPIAHRQLVLREAEIDARNYILKFVDKDKKDCWIQVWRLKILLLSTYCLLSFNPSHIPSSRYIPKKIGMKLLRRLTRV